MSDRLDLLLATLRDRPREPLPGLEARVWATIDSWRAGRASSYALAPLRVASVVAALGLGMVGGSLAVRTTHTAPEVSAFSIDARLAPSTLLLDR